MEPGPRRLSRAVPPGGPHEILIVRGSAYSVSGRNTGLPADLAKPWHYPVRAVCGICGLVVSREEMAVERQDWVHADRKPGESQ